MAEDFKFNPDSLEFHQDSRKKTVAKFIGSILFLTLLIGLGIFILFSAFTDNQKERELKESNRIISQEYDRLSKIYKENEHNLKELEQQDYALYQLIFGKNPTANTPQTSSSIDLEEVNITELVEQNDESIAELFQMLEKSKALSERIANVYENNSEQINTIPAIQPIPNSALSLLTYGYGQRLDPIYHTPGFHSGIDYNAPIGTPVFATANGKIIKAGYGKKAHGKTVEIKHGDYTTRYRHLSRITVDKGKKIKRGEIIGYVGTSGKALLPHLHYEVVYKGKSVNPVFFFFMELSPSQFAEIYKQSDLAGISLD